MTQWGKGALLVSLGTALAIACGPKGQGGAPVEPRPVEAAPAPIADAGPAEPDVPNVPFAMLGGGPRHPFRALVPGPAKAPVEIAAYRTGGRIAASPVIGPDGTIYVGSIDGTFNAIRRDGRMRWSYVAGAPIFSTAAVSESGAVYVGCDDDTLLAFTADGAIRWTYRQKQDVDSSPVIAEGGAIYVGGEGLHAVSASGERRWMSLLGGGHVSASPAVLADGRVAVGSHDYRVYALEPDGTTAWAFATGGAVEGPIAVLEGGDLAFGSADGKLYRLTAEGRRRFAIDVGGAVRGGVAVADGDGALYVGTMAGELVAVDAARGEIEWRLKTGGPIRATPVLDPERRLYVGSRDHGLYAVDAATGEIVWRRELGAEIDAAVAIAAGRRLVVASDDGAVRILGEAP
jgi:outer membrane protein assembly factor BamB